MLNGLVLISVLPHCGLLLLPEFVSQRNLKFYGNGTLSRSSRPHKAVARIAPRPETERRFIQNILGN
ncbi:hypothetical protein X797_004571 [Metarhizium robertsii]|uniref:Secreted protein n=1 Tax=Metarhizium robertsii TaxID=568076 RepID=A0A0A1UX09_9HYPO|nr:hypothetical protein X797_004571 [Metarhizium robertsii]